MTAARNPVLFLTPGSSSAHLTPALVAHAQGGLTLGPEEGGPDADFCHLGIKLLRHLIDQHLEVNQQVTSLFFIPFPLICSVHFLRCA